VYKKQQKISNDLWGLKNSNTSPVSQLAQAMAPKQRRTTVKGLPVKLATALKSARHEKKMKGDKMRRCQDKVKEAKAKMEEAEDVEKVEEEQAKVDKAEAELQEAQDKVKDSEAKVKKAEDVRDRWRNGTMTEEDHQMYDDDDDDEQPGEQHEQGNEQHEQQVLDRFFNELEQG
jgi:hypothetical protein